MHLLIYASQQILDILSHSANQHLCGYIDPGTGSFITQLIIAAFVGSSFAIKIFWSKIKIFIKGIFGKKGKTPEK